MALIFPALLPAQQKGGNNLIRPLADLEKDLKGKLERIKAHGKSLKGNLEGDSADRDVFVYLPPSYQREPNRRFPVVYTLHGYGLHAEQWVGFANFAALEKDVAAGSAQEMILVSPDAFSLHNGSFIPTRRPPAIGRLSSPWSWSGISTATTGLWPIEPAAAWWDTRWAALERFGWA